MVTAQDILNDVQSRAKSLFGSAKEKVTGGLKTLGMVKNIAEPFVKEGLKRFEKNQPIKLSTVFGGIKRTFEEGKNLITGGAKQFAEGTTPSRIPFTGFDLPPKVAGAGKIALGALSPLNLPGNILEDITKQKVGEIPGLKETAIPGIAGFAANIITPIPGPSKLGKAEKAVSKLEGLAPDVIKAVEKLSTEDRNIMGKFVELVESGGAKKAMGQIGKDAQAIAEGLGLEKGITNKKLAEVFNKAVEFADTKGVRPIVEATKVVTEKATRFISEIPQPKSLLKLFGEDMTAKVPKPGAFQRIKEGIGSIFDTFRPLVDANIREARTVLSRTPLGKTLADGLDRVFNRYQTLEGQTVNTFQKMVAGFSDVEFTQALDFREGIVSQVSERVSQLAKSLDKIFEPFADLAQKTGLEIRLPDGTAIPWQPRTGYVPHIVDIEKLKQFKDVTINFLVKTNQLSQEVASKLVNGMLEGKSSSSLLSAISPETTPKLFGNLEFARVIDFPTEVLKRGKDLVVDYIHAASKRIAQAEEFGPVNQKLEDLITKISGESPDAKLIEEVTMRELGLQKKDFGQEKVSSLLRAWQGVTKLGTAAISNLSQSVNTATTYGIGRTLMAIVNDIKNSTVSREFAMNAGGISEAAIREIMQESTGVASKVGRAFTAPGFQKVETFNRAVAANAGKSYVLDEFGRLLKGAKGSAENLKKMGVDVAEAVKSGKLSENDLINAARTAVKETQFTVRPLDLPANWTTTYGRVVTQFKNFAFKQGQFVAKNVISPAIQLIKTGGREGSLTPLIRYTLLGTLVGEGVADTKALITGRERPTDPLQRVVDNILSVGGVGLPADLYKAVTTRGAQGLLSWITGPTITEAAEIGAGVADVVRGKGFTKLGRTLSRDIPVIGPRVSKTLFPTKGKSGEVGGSLLENIFGRGTSGPIMAPR